ncbi:uncharacterized protein CTRU02_207761 [Colletotrichum truncatum]|uniref:Uncharacterized protein n=1 Tax=Colletotrichum truncatum TaxID=5467 RepID=A0ACC3Z1R5_COLTU|nr:uncharacterized protein CTRU02_09138 [Colletotrichum truncatum]KAF6788817.1 hypothetical protein CTRU02_09138 [Colletotrichum truncatum]
MALPQTLSSPSPVNPSPSLTPSSPRSSSRTCPAAPAPAPSRSSGRSPRSTRSGRRPTGSSAAPRLSGERTLPTSTASRSCASRSSAASSSARSSPRSRPPRKFGIHKRLAIGEIGRKGRVDFEDYGAGLERDSMGNPVWSASHSSIGLLHFSFAP